MKKFASFRWTEQPTETGRQSRQRHGSIDRKRNRQTDMLRYWKTETVRETNAQTHKETQKSTDRQGQRRQTDTCKKTHKIKQTKRQKPRQTDRQRARQTDRERDETFLAWSGVRKDGIIAFLRLYLSCHNRSSLTVGSDATKNYNQHVHKNETFKMHVSNQYSKQSISQTIRLTDYILTEHPKFIHSGYFYSASSSPLPLRGAPDTAWKRTTVSEGLARGP